VPSPGDIVLVRFPYSNLTDSKRRPALVVAEAGDGDFVFARITSQPSFERSDLFISRWQDLGLKLPSWLQLSKLALLDSSQLFGVVSTLDADTERDARQLFMAWIAEAWPPPQ